MQRPGGACRGRRSGLEWRGSNVRSCAVWRGAASWRGRLWRGGGAGRVIPGEGVPSLHLRRACLEGDGLP
eukprot:7986195-Heterocapsa_arctica.AAC.1